MKKLIAAILIASTLIWAATPNVPLYLYYDGQIASPTQFLNRVFIAGTNVILVDNRTNLTIHASPGGAGTAYIVADTITSNGVMTQLMLASNTLADATTTTSNGLVSYVNQSSRTIATNTTEEPMDFALNQWFELPTLMVSAIKLSTTNLSLGKEIWVHLQAANGTYTVDVQDMAGGAIHWSYGSPTNGPTSFTVTNNGGAELSIKVWSNNIINAVYAPFH